jgi:hypothetical protein
MTGGSKGKVVYLHLRSVENGYYTCRGVWHVKSRIHGVFETKSDATVCCTQSHIFTVFYLQISLEYVSNMCTVQLRLDLSCNW